MNFNGFEALLLIFNSRGGGRGGLIFTVERVYNVHSVHSVHSLHLVNPVDTCEDPTGALTGAPTRRH